MNVVIYARFSSHSQTEQSIEGQLKVCYEYAESNHYTVVGEYIDRAISGTTDNRAEFQRMISCIEDRVVNECLKMLTEEKIRFIAKKVAEECAKSPDNLTAKALKKAIR